MNEHLLGVIITCLTGFIMSSSYALIRTVFHFFDERTSKLSTNIMDLAAVMLSMVTSIVIGLTFFLYHFSMVVILTGKPDYLMYLLVVGGCVGFGILLHVSAVIYYNKLNKKDYQNHVI